ncbi:MAG: HlyD family efflux transporter periplasmic adaptor subunit [Firmicutes bacterium]|nr:HlyD family efflux transporter periplasmic adaptor subunit [Bacillota bacterium]
MENSLFRKSSLERIASPERLNEYIKITHPGVWSVLFACLALMIAVGFWAIYGNIPDTVRAKGIIFPQHGVTSVIPPAGGRINNMRVKAGDFVQIGQIIAVIPQEELIRRINELKNSPDPDEGQIAALRSEYERLSLIVAPVSGIVVSARAANETVSSSEVVATIVKLEKYADDKQIVCYVPVSTARKLREGMEVQVSPDFAPREEYGFMYGHITSIGSYPVSQSDVLAAVGSMQYAQELLPPENSVEVRVTLTIDPGSQNKIKWSSKKGESLALSIGTYCNLQIVTRNYKPYELIF